MLMTLLIWVILLINRSSCHGISLVEMDRKWVLLVQTTCESQKSFRYWFCKSSLNVCHHFKLLLLFSFKFQIFHSWINHYFVRWYFSPEYYISLIFNMRNQISFTISFTLTWSIYRFTIVNFIILTYLITSSVFNSWPFVTRFEYVPLVVRTLITRPPPLLQLSSAA